VEQEVGVAESKKVVAAIFLLPVWPLAPPGRWFLPYFGRYDRRIARDASSIGSFGQASA